MSRQPLLVVRATGSDLHSQPARKLSIALVTDDEQLLQVCARVLGQAGFVVHPARHSGHALLTCLAGEPIDVLLVELSMPEGSGPALMRRMRHHSPNLRALYFARAGTACTADNVLVRPFTRDDLLTALSALSRQAPAS